MNELVSELARPVHGTHLRATSGARGALILDAGTISIVLDGVLGGDGRTPQPELDPQGLTAPQTALVARVIDGIVRSLSDTLSRKFGFSVQAVAPEAEEATSEAAPVACSFEIQAGGRKGRAVLLLAKEVFLGTPDEGQQRAQREDPRVARVVEEVELDLVVELARVALPIATLASLKVGDVIRLDTAVGSAVEVRADGHVVLRGHPTTHAGQIAIRLAGRHAS